MTEYLESREKLLSQEWQALMVVFNEFLDVSDKEFVQDLDFEDALGYAYGRLLENGHDADAVLEAAGVTQNEV